MMEGKLFVVLSYYEGTLFGALLYYEGTLCVVLCIDRLESKYMSVNSKTTDAPIHNHRRI